ncbi:MAG: GntR family transcriptional regulator [Schleiferilactobacillus perolens]|uniref:GntR family transcriptional regulator n=1 Tax=Schleiferilactobacillus perolens TaxID=100468 RepID=UPI0039EC075A
MHRSPKYVQVYNSILAMIHRAQFPTGAKLPAEEVLADEFSVSRVTLRTALSLLREDGVITSIHGQGHFVTNTAESPNDGLEFFGSPLYSSITEKISTKMSYFHENSPSEFTDQLFNTPHQPYYTLNIWYQNDKGNIANNLAIVDPNTILHYGVDLNDPEQIIDFLENTIYSEGGSSKLTVTVSDRPTSTFQYPFANNTKEPLMLLTEDVFATNGDRLTQNKYYIPIHYFRASLMRYPSELENRLAATGKNG